MTNHSSGQQGHAIAQALSKHGAETVLVSGPTNLPNPHNIKVVKTGIKLSIPCGFYGRIAPRSGLAVKQGVDVLAGVIDSGYNGEIGVVLINTDKFESVSLPKSSRIAQLIFEKCEDMNFETVLSLDISERDAGGFGSTGD